nr:serine hydrolase domain-containing protein [uncultured Dyadobacter sp.]
MKIITLKYLKISLFICAGLLYSCREKSPVPSTVEEAVTNAVDPYIVTGANVGVIVGVIRNGSKTVYSFGEKELGAGDKITSKSVLELASITKTFTAIALADLHLRNSVNLDDPIEKYLPLQVKVPSYNGTKITLRHLANHTSGFPRAPKNMDKEAFNPYVGYSEEKMYEFVNGYTLTREPGTEFEYSNVGYGLLGQILSNINRSDYEKMVTDRVLRPLGMKHTTVSFTNDQLQNLVQGHYGKKKVDSWAKYMENILQGTGSLLSNMDDMLVYLEANMNSTNTPLRDAIALTHQPTFRYSGDHQDGIGLGWSLLTTDNLHVIWKNGGNGGYTSFIGFDKSTKTGVVILTNSSLNPDPFQTQMGFEILKAVQQFP